MTTAKLAISRIHFPITSLGYGRRIALWTQGCSIGCKGCMSIDTWVSRRADTPIDEIVSRFNLWLAESDGVTLSGGEPFDQPDAIIDLLKAIRPRVTGDILLFSGYAFHEIPNSARPALDYLDAVVCGPFVEHRASDLPLRGSDNQELCLLTPLAEGRYSDLEMKSWHVHRIDLVDTDGTIWFAGIPKPGDLNRLGVGLSARAVSLKTSLGRLGET